MISLDTDFKDFFSCIEEEENRNKSTINITPEQIQIWDNDPETQKLLEDYSILINFCVGDPFVIGKRLFDVDIFNNPELLSYLETKSDEMWEMIINQIEFNNQEVR